MRDPSQIRIGSGQDVGLLIVQVLDAVLHLAQKHVGIAHGIGCGLRHQSCPHQALQGALGGAGAQLGELTATHHLQELYGKFDFANAPAREFDIVGALGLARTAFVGVVAYLAVQDAQGIKNAVV